MFLSFNKFRVEVARLLSFENVKKSVQEAKHKSFICASKGQTYAGVVKRGGGEALIRAATGWTERKWKNKDLMRVKCNSILFIAQHTRATRRRGQTYQVIHKKKFTALLYVCLISTFHHALAVRRILQKLIFVISLDLNCVWNCSSWNRFQCFKHKTIILQISNVKTNGS